MSFEQETFGAAIAYMNQTLAGAGSLKGEKGDKGDTGETGPKGEKGDTGESGASAYDIALENGFEGSEKDWLNSLTPTNIATTTDYTMPGSYEGRLLFKEIAGKTEQLTSTGANVLEEVKVDASLTQWDNIFLAKADLKPSTQYTISFIGAVGNKYYPNEKVFEQAPTFVVEKGINKVVVTTRADVTSQKMSGDYDGFYTILKNGILQPNANKFENVMMNLGSVALPYEPYGVGIPFIRSVAIDGIKTHRKNLLENNATSQTKSGISFDVNEDKSVTINGTSTDGSSWILLKDNISLKSGQILNGVTGGGTDPLYANYFIQLWDNNANGIIVNHGDGEYVVESDYDNVGVFVGVKDGSTVEDVTIYPMIRNADIEDATYEPYCGSSVTFSTPIELNKIGDVQDVIVDGKLTKRLASVVLDGTVEPMSVSEGNNGGTVIGYRYDDIGMWAVDRNRNVNRVCDRLQPPTTTTPNDFKDCEIGHWGFNNVGYNDEFFIFCIDENFTTFSEVQTWLSTHPIRIVFEIVREYPDMPVVDQIALNSVKTCDGTTYLEIDSPLEPDFKCEYGTSKVGACVLEGILTGRNAEIIAEDNAKRIAALEATIVNNI